MAKPSEPLRAVEDWAGQRAPGSRLTLLAGDGGRRQYFRLEGTGRLALFGPDPAENLAWLRIGRHLWFQGLPLPRILEYDLPAGLFLLEDLGDELLAGRADDDYYYQAVEIAARLHVKGLEGFDFCWCHQSRSYGPALAAKAEIGYFLDYLVGRYLGLKVSGRALRHEILALAALAAGDGRDQVLMHRDYQGRNLMINKGRLHVLDWQGARLGPAVYDLSSLMEETPGRRLSAELRESLTRHYFKARGLTGRQSLLRKALAAVAPVRMMQALGAYGKLSLEGKAKFSGYIPPALERLREMMNHDLARPFPNLRAVTEEAFDLIQGQL